LGVAHGLCHSGLLKLAHFSSHQLDARIFKSLSALVIHRYPTDDVNEIALLGCHDVVVCFPGHSARDVGELHRKFS